MSTIVFFTRLFGVRFAADRRDSQVDEAGKFGFGDGMGKPYCVVDFRQPDGSRLRRRFDAPRAILVARQLEEVTPLLRDVQQRAMAGQWAAGFVGYEAAGAFDAAYATQASDPAIPLAAFMMFDAADDMAAIDAGAFACGSWVEETPPGAYQAAVAAIRAAIGRGDYYQANYTARLRAQFSGDAAGLFAALQEAQPGGYALYADFGDRQIASVSPELFFAWDPVTRRLTTKPMKGTLARDGTASAAMLRRSAKDRAENLMIVDLLRNDLSRVSEVGSVTVPELFTVEALPTAFQMSSTVTGTALPGVGLAEIFTALFPCGSITGAPKIAAMQAIAALEASPRGVYCGAIGIVQPGGAALFNVGIRTVTVADGMAHCGVGGGVVWDSTPDRELAESRVKRRFLLRATANFELLETMRLENGRFTLQERHIARMLGSAAHFGFAVTSAAVEQALDRMAAAHGSGIYRVRVLAARNGGIRAEAFPFAPEAGAYAVQLAQSAIDSDEEFLRHKTTQREVYQRHAPKDSAVFDTLLFNQRDEITEFTRGNVAVRTGGLLVTPPVECGLLPGVRRAAMLGEGVLAEEIISRAALLASDEIYFLNSLRGIMRVRLGTDHGPI